MGKPAALVCAIALAITCIAYGDSDGEGGSLSTTEQALTSAGRETKPYEIVDSSSYHTSDANHNEDCSCTYEYEDQSVEAKIGQNALKVGDTIKRGKIVSFKCKYVRMVLTWQNGLRVRDGVSMICNICKKWQRNDVPICKIYNTSDALITFYGYSHIYPGGIAIAQKGEENQFSCYNRWRYPEWDYDQRENVYVKRNEDVRSFHISRLVIKEEENEVSGKYECYMKNDSDHRLGSTFLHLQVKANCSDLPPSIEHGRVKNPSSVAHGSVVRYACEDSYILVGETYVQCAFGMWTGNPPQCQEIGCEVPNIARGSLKEERLGDWVWKLGSLQWERVRQYVGIPSGRNISSGTVLWFYCDEPYSVHGNGRRRVQTRCIRGRWTTELQCLLDGEVLVPSTAISILNRWTTAPELPCSIFGVVDEYLPPSTTPKAEEWASSINVDEREPEEVVISPTSQEPPAKECFCEYPVEDNSIVALADGSRLFYGDRVRNGSTVFFHCLHVGYHRLRGHREITCNGCQSWDVSDFPFCVPPKIGDAVILFNRDIDVLPGGNIEIHKGQNVNFTCVAILIAQFPNWSAPETPGISMIKERRERKDCGDVVYLTHLEIQNADYENEGTYECYIDHSHKTMLQVVITDGEDRITTTTVPEVPTGGKVTQPSVEVETSSHQTSDPKHNEDCFCIYEYEHEFVKAQIGQRALKVGDTIRRGERVSLECAYVGMALTWQNGLRLIGKANLVCSTCTKWQRNDVPTCKNSERSEVVIAFTDDINILPGGTAIVKKRHRNQFACINSWKYPEWDYGQKRGVSVNKSAVSVSGNLYYVSYLDIGEDENASNGVYECYINDGHGQRIGSGLLQLQAYDQKCSILDLVESVPEVVELDMSEVTEEYVILGFEVKLKCGDKFVITGDSKAVCEKQGKWKLGNFGCIPGCVLNLASSSHLLVEPKKEGYRIGERIILSCPPGEVLSSDVEQLMCLPKFWSDSLPDCIDVKKKPGL